MKILSFGDLHIYQYHQFSKPEDFGYTTRLNEHLVACKNLAKLIETVSPDLVCCGGDVFHTQSRVDTIVLDCASACIDVINQSCKKIHVPFDIIVGNHDILSDNNRSSNALIPFRNWDNVRLHESIDVDNNIVYLPYITEPNRVASHLKSIDISGKVGLAHLDFRGAKFNDTFIDDQGMETDLFKDFELVIGHHYHLPQKMKNMVFPGSLQVFSFREPRSPLTRGVILYDTESKEVKRLPVSSPDWITITDDSEDIKSQLEFMPSDNYVRLLLSSDYALSSNDISEDYIKSKFKGVEIQYDLNRISAISRIRSKADRATDLGETEEESLKGYINSRVESEDERKELLKVGISILGKVK